MAGCVLLLHGLGRTHRSMASLESRIAAAGHETLNIGYRSRWNHLEALADEVAASIESAAPSMPLTAVTHSMGGIIVRLLADRFPWAGVVQMTPPNRGSRLARWVTTFAPIRWIMGPACLELARGGPWPDPPKPCGIIAATAGATWDNPPAWLAVLRGVFTADEVHDGTVTLEETIHQAATDLALVDASHTRVMNHPDTVNLVLKFLDTGGFGTAGMEPASAEHVTRSEPAVT